MRENPNVPLKRKVLLFRFCTLLIFSLLILSLSVVHAQRPRPEPPETVNPTNPPQILTPVLPETALIKAALAMAAEEILPKLKSYEIYLAANTTLTIEAASVRPAGERRMVRRREETESHGMVQFLNREGEVIAEFYTTRILGWRCSDGPVSLVTDP